MSDNGQRYVQRQGGFFIEKLSVDAYQGTQGATQIVALNASGYVDDSLLGTHFGTGLISINGLTGAIITSGGLVATLNSSGQIVLIGASGTGGSGGIDAATRPCSYVGGKPTAGQEVLAYTAEATETFPANFALPQSYASCGVNPTAPAVYSIFKNGSTVGTIAVSIAGVFTFATTSGVAFSLNPNDRLTIVAPGSVDATMAGVSITLVGTRAGLPTGVAPPVLTWRGVYNGSTIYSPFDLVSYLGSSYVCIAVSTGNLPTNTSFWNLVAQAGATGASFGVQTVNSLTGNVTISGGNNVSVTQVGQTVLISASGGGGSSGSSYPFKVVQQSYYSTGGGTFTATFPQTAAASGNTLFMIVSSTGDAAFTVPSGWTVDFNIQQPTYARLLLLHKTSASDTSAFFSNGSSTYSILFFEMVGSRALDQVASGGVANTNFVSMPSITPSVGSQVLCAVGLVNNGSASVPTITTQPLFTTWVPFGTFTNGSFRALTGYISPTVGAGVSVTPPIVNLSSIPLFGGGGIAYATFSIL